MKFPFLRKEKFGLREQSTFIGKKCEIFIPSYYFEDNMAEIIGEHCEVIGIYWFRIDDGKMYSMELPLRVAFSFSNTYTKKNLKLSPKVQAMDFTIFELKAGDAFIYNLRREQSNKDINFFISKLIEGAKLSPLVSYDSVANLFFNALSSTGVNDSLGVPSLSYEFLLSELYRDRNNMTNEFRFAYNGKNLAQCRMVRITKIPELTSVFASITGEDINNQLINSVARTRLHLKDKESPLEKIIKY